MKTSNLHPVAPNTDLAVKRTEVHDGPRRELPDTSRPIAVVASDRRLEALEPAWEQEEPKFTAAECSAMSIQRLRRLCDEAFSALDSVFPAWGARDEYEILCAELTIRAQALKNWPRST